MGKKLWISVISQIFFLQKDIDFTNAKYNVNAGPKAGSKTNIKLLLSDLLLWPLRYTCEALH